MLAAVVFRLHDVPMTVGAGAIIGRSFTADIAIQDGRISEAHAQVSLRGNELVLLPLRGRLRVDGRDVSRVSLREGLQIELARDVTLTVLSVRLPSHALGLEAPGVPAQVLTGVTSVCLSPALHLVAGVSTGAAALLFSDGLHWFAREGAQEARPLREGETVHVGGHALNVIAVPMTGTPETSPVVPRAALKLTCRENVAHLWPAGATEPLLVSGQSGQLLRLLLDAGAPVRWETLAAHLWPGEDDRELVRHRFDVLLGKLRRRLDAAGVRRDFITSHRTGLIELVRYPGDQLSAELAP